MSPIHRECDNQESSFPHERVIMRVFFNCRNKLWRVCSSKDISFEQFLFVSVSFSLLCKRNNLCGKYNSVLSTEQIPCKPNVDCLDLRTVQAKFIS